MKELLYSAAAQPQGFTLSEDSQYCFDDREMRQPGRVNSLSGWDQFTF